MAPDSNIDALPQPVIPNSRTNKLSKFGQRNNLLKPIVQMPLWDGISKAIWKQIDHNSKDHIADIEQDNEIVNHSH